MNAYFEERTKRKLTKMLPKKSEIAKWARWTKEAEEFEKTDPHRIADRNAYWRYHNEKK
jgi:hypothetical protein